LAGTVQTDSYKEILSELVILREARGMSQAQLAEKLGKPPSFVGKYELGERRLDVIEFMVIINALDEKIDAFLGRLNEELPKFL